MLFGNNPWSRRPSPPIMQPMGGQPQMQPQMQPQAQPQYATPTWPSQTPDGAYAGGLANYYAGQLQNQMVPGTVLPPNPMAGPPMGAQQPPLQQPVQHSPFQRPEGRWGGILGALHGFHNWRHQGGM
jgi:hypothetical protein